VNGGKVNWSALGSQDAAEKQACCSSNFAHRLTTRQLQCAAGQVIERCPHCGTGATRRGRVVAAQTWTSAEYQKCGVLWLLPWLTGHGRRRLGRLPRLVGGGLRVARILVINYPLAYASMSLDSVPCKFPLSPVFRCFNPCPTDIEH
jgi:hypothetical protein